MRILRRIALAALLCVLAVVSFWLIASGWLVGQLRVYAEEALGRALHTRVVLRDLEISFLPPRVVARELEVGEEEERSIHFSDATVRILPHASVTEFRPVVEVAVHDLFLDLRQLLRDRPPEAPARPETREEGERAAPLLPFRVDRLHLTGTDLRIPYGADVLRIEVERIEGEAVVDAVERQLDARLDAADLRLRRDEREQQLARVAVRIEQVDEGIVIRDFEIEGEGVLVTSEPQPLSLDREYRLRADVDLSRLGFFVDELSGLAGELLVEGDLEGPIWDPDGAVDVAIRELQRRDAHVGALRAALGKEGDRLEIRSLHGEVLGGELTSKGHIVLASSMEHGLDLEWKGIDSRRLAALFEVSLERAISIRGEASSSGALNPPRIDLRGEGALQPGGAAVPVAWSAQARFDRGGGEAAVRLQQDEINRLRAAVSIGPERVLGGEVEVRLTDTGALRSLLLDERAPAIRGSLSISADLSGTVDSPSLTGQVEGRDLQAAGMTLERLEARLSADADQARIQRLSAQLGGGTVSLEGTAGWAGTAANDLKLSAQRISTDVIVNAVHSLTGEALPIWRGLLSVDASLQGAWARPDLDATVTVERFWLGNEPFSRLAARLEAEWPHWSGELSLIHSEPQRLGISAHGTGWEQLDLSFQSTEWQLGELRGASLQQIGGTVSAHGNVRGPLRALDGEVELAVADLLWQGRGFGDVRAHARAQAGLWELDGSFLGGAASLVGRVSSEAGWPADVRLAWQDARLGPLLRTEEQLDVTSSGAFELTLLLGEPSGMDGRLRIETFRIARGAYQITAPIPIEARVRDGQLVIESMRLEGEQTTLSVAGTAGLDGAVDLTVQGSGDLVVAEVLVDQIKSARGSFQADLAIERTSAGELDLSGRASVDDAAIDVGLPVVFTDTRASVQLDDTQVRIEQLHGRAGGGELDVSGVVDVAEGLALRWQVTEINTGFIEWLEHEVSGEGTVTGSWRELTIAGDVDVLRVLYDKRIGLTDFLPWFRREVSRPPEPAQEAEERIVRLNLHIVAPDEVFVDNNFAKMELRADLYARGRLDRLRLAGQIEVLSGQAMFQGRIFEVTSGVVEFRPPLGLTATLNINAQTTVETPDGDYTVYVQIAGTTADPEVILTSDDPALTQTDLVSLITFGRTTAQLQARGGGISVYDLVVLGTGAYREGLEEGVREVLPIDRIDIEPSFSRTTGAFEPRFSIGKDLTEDLSTTLATTIGVQNQYRAEVEYRLTQWISLLGVWESETEEEAGAFGGNLKFQHRFRSLPRFCLFSWCRQGRRDGRG